MKVGRQGHALSAGVQAKSVEKMQQSRQQRGQAVIEVTLTTGARWTGGPGVGTVWMWLEEKGPKAHIGLS